MAVKAGYKGAVYIGAQKIGGATTWNYSGDTRQMHEDTEFGDEIMTHIPGQIEGGEITVTGNYLMHEDTGQQLLKTRFEAGTAMTDIKLYYSYSDSQYMTPDSTTTPASFATLTNYNAVGTDRAGIGTFTMTLKISGKLTCTY